MRRYGYVPGNQTNLYPYVGDSPVTERDPSGKVFGIDDVALIALLGDYTFYTLENYYLTHPDAVNSFVSNGLDWLANAQSPPDVTPGDWFFNNMDLWKQNYEAIQDLWQNLQNWSPLQQAPQGNFGGASGTGSQCPIGGYHGPYISGENGSATGSSPF
jgi:hypothetical protein